MSPEQLTGQKLDPRTDLYSTGIVFYELLTGRLPFIAQDTTEAITARLYRDPEPPARFAPTIPAALDRFVMRLLARVRDQRFASTREAIEELRQLKF